MEIQILVKVFFVKCFDGCRVRRGDMRVSHVLPHHRAVLRLHQPVVVGVPRPRFRLLDQQLVQQLGHGVINELAAVVRVKPAKLEGELPQHRLQHRQQIGFADLRRGAHHLPLRDFIHRVNVIHPLASLQIALMHRIHPQISRAAIRLRPAALPDRHLRRPGRLIHDPLFPIPPTLPEPVQLRHRDLGQTRVGRILEIIVGPLQKLLRRRSAERLVHRIHGGQPFDIRARVPLRKPMPPIRLRLNFLPAQVLLNQSRYLRAAEPRHLLQVPPH